MTRDMWLNRMWAKYGTTSERGLYAGLVVLATCAVLIPALTHFARF